MSSPFRSAPEFDHLRAEFERGERNSDHLRSIWEDALRDHSGEWVLVYGEQQVRYDRNVDALLAGLAPEDRVSAVLRFVTEIPYPLVL